MATLMMDTTPLYPTLFPSPGEPAAYSYYPVHSPKDEEEARQQEQQQQQQQAEEEGGEGMPVEGLQEEGQEESGSGHCQEQSTDTREATTGAETQQTTNGDTVASENTAPCSQDSSDQPVDHTPQCNGQTVDEDHQSKLREQCVGRAWDEFVTHFLLGSCHIQKAAIFDLATRRPVAVNGNLRISTEELEQIAISLHHLQLAYRNGVTIEGKTYKVRLADGRNGILARTEREGCTVCKTHSLIIIGVHDERGSSRKCNEDVMRLGDFFRKKGV